MADLSDVKAGDSLVIEVRNPYCSGPPVNYALLKVDRVTKTQVVCGSVRYRIDTGRKIGKGYGSEAMPATEGLIKTYRNQVAARTKYIVVRNLIENIDHAARNDNLSESEQDQLLAMFKDKNWS